MRPATAALALTLLAAPSTAAVRFDWDPGISASERERLACRITTAYTDLASELSDEERSRFLGADVLVHVLTAPNPDNESIYALATVPREQDHIVIYGQIIQTRGALESTAYHEFVHLHDRIEGRIPQFVRLSGIARYEYPFPEETPAAILELPDEVWEPYECERADMEVRAMERELTRLDRVKLTFGTSADPDYSYSMYRGRLEHILSWRRLEICGQKGLNTSDGSE